MIKRTKLYVECSLGSILVFLIFLVVRTVINAFPVFLFLFFWCGIISLVIALFLGIEYLVIEKQLRTSKYIEFDEVRTSLIYDLKKTLVRMEGWAFSGIAFYFFGYLVEMFVTHQ